MPAEMSEKADSQTFHTQILKLEFPQFELAHYSFGYPTA